MRLWHTDLIPVLPSVKDVPRRTNQLGGQHTEIRMILGIIRKRGKVNHATVNYVNNYSLAHLYAYGILIIDEMKRRGFRVSESIEAEYRNDVNAIKLVNQYKTKGIPIFFEHSEEYKQECLENLKQKGINIEI